MPRCGKPCLAQEQIPHHFFGNKTTVLVDILSPENLAKKVVGDKSSSLEAVSNVGPR